MARVPPWVRLLFIGLWNLADEEGRLRGSAKYVGAQVFPYDEGIDVEAGLRMLEELGRVVRYQHDGEAFLWVCHFSQHQKTDPRLTSKLPAPPPATPHTQSTPTSRGELGALRTSTLDSSGADKLAPSRWQVAGGREQVAGDRGAPPVDAVRAVGALAAPPAVLAGAQPDRRASPRVELPPPRDGPSTLRDRLEVVWLTKRTKPYRWRSQDDNACRELLTAAADDWGEIERRWAVALARQRYPTCSSVPELAQHWNHYATDEPKAGGGKDPRNSPVRAEDVPRDEFTKTGTSNVL